MSDADDQQPTPEGHEQFIVADMANENAKFYGCRGEADVALEKAQDAPGVEPELFLPGESPAFLYDGEPPADNSEDATADAPETAADRLDAQPVQSDPIQTEELPDRSVADDPLKWVPGEFVDEIDGTQAINRKGFEVLSHFYSVSVTATVQVGPEKTNHEYARVKATATMPDGRTCEAFGSAHVDRGDDAFLLLEMADTRARKRALSIATGVGAVAVAELKSEVQA